MDITAITVNYNTPELLNNMLATFRKYYDINVLVVDGSDEIFRKQTISIIQKYDNVKGFIFDYNIHHGPGLGYALTQVETSKVLFIDSDVYFHKGGFIEDLDSKLRSTSYGIGDVQIIDDKGFNAAKGIKYLHPAFCLLNTEIAKNFKSPMKHGAPMIEAMKDIHSKGLSDEILQHEQWITNDFRSEEKNYLTHDWQGTVAKFGYNL